MASSSDKQRVVDYINPFAQPQPSDETGPGTHFNSVQKLPHTSAMPTQEASKNPFTTTTPIQEQHTGASTTSISTNPYRRTSIASKTPIVNTHRRNVSNGGSRSPRADKFPSIAPPPAYRQDAFGSGEPSGRRSSESPREHIQTRPRRVSSLNERFPGDPSVRPLDQIRHDAKAADRAPHLRKKHIPGADTVDRLDDAAIRRYHHEGPYDAALLARNTSYTSSPVAALETTNREALKATPQENIRDSVERHRPLDGVARVPSGERDTSGRKFEYQEGPDVNREEGGDMGRWPGIDYHHDDLKGQGEPAFSLERRIKDRHNGQDPLDDTTYIELVERPKRMSHDFSGVRTSHDFGGLRTSRRTSHDVGAASASASASASGSRTGSRAGSPSARVTGSPTTMTTGEASGSHHGQGYGEWEQGRKASRSGSKRLSVDLKRRIGSLRRKERKVDLEGDDE